MTLEEANEVIENTSNRHIQISNDIIWHENITPRDVVVLAGLLSHRNSETGLCNPSMELLAKELDTTKTSIKNGIDNLVKCKYIEVKKVNRSNHYKILLSGKFEKFSYDFLYLDMPINLKGYYIMIQQFLFKDKLGSSLKMNNKILSELTHIPERTIKQYNASLRDRGYLVETSTRLTCLDKSYVEKKFDLIKLNQAVVFKLNEIDKKVDEMRNDMNDEIAIIKDTDEKRNNLLRTLIRKLYPDLVITDATSDEELMDLINGK